MKWGVLFMLFALSGCSLIQENPMPVSFSGDGPPFLLLTEPFGW
ncbi:hypothetical protein [Paraburkholderia acidicola]|uniref:Lipoprotein n=1 Tax=Paraburkholderia acidicola TaxID=1912599 RepID=A0ABV1LGS4_9BURK|nr:hypothetical protein [Paraburkholderia acidicola]